MNKSLHVVIMYILVQLGLIFFLYPGEIIESASAGHWLPIVFGFAVYLFCLWLYLKGMSWGGKKDIVDLYGQLGTTVSAILLAPVFMYFIIQIIVTIRAYSEIMSIVFLSNTPLWAIMLLLLAVPTYLANKGMRTIFGAGVLVACFGLPLVLFITIASFQNVNWHYIFPLVGENVDFFTKASYYRSFFVYTGSFMFLGFVQPFYTFRTRSVIVTALCLLPMLLCAVYVPILTFGEATAVTLFFPFVVTLDVIHINWLMFERVAVFFLLSLISMMMLLLALTLWQSVRIMRQFIPRIPVSCQLIVIAAGIFAVCLSIPNIESVQHLFSWNLYVRFYLLIAVPITVYFLGHRAKKEAQHEKTAAGR
ncbi:GerAB/ArcD/ProY family transporter [Paenibacillus whitsoniae]|nr:GerAB/ArcD/ProY family transporter [Paenibacillus whitsoniae]